MDIADHLDWLENYVAARVRIAKKDPEPLILKLEHTKRVLANGRRIAVEENFAPDIARACVLASLYHDLSRFEQYLQYDTFKDAQSRNHGAWSTVILKTEKRLQDETPAIRKRVLIAVCLHNRLAVPARIGGDLANICHTVRDADKLDILRVMDEHLSAGKPYNPTVILGLPDDPELCGRAVINAALAGLPATYGDLRSLNDFRLLLGTWLYGLNFESSRKLFADAGHARRLVESLPDNEVYGAARKKVLNEIESCVRTANSGRGQIN